MPEGRDGEQAPDAALAAPGAVLSPSATHTVFVSYASSDRAVADSVCAALERAGVTCWIAPRDVTPGEFYSEAIVHAIDSAKVVVLVLSQNAAVSQHVLREVERASSKRHPVVSFRIDLAPIPAALEYFLNTSQWLDASATGVERALPKLVDAVQRGVAHASDPAASHSGDAARPMARTDPDVAVATQARRRSRLTLAALAAITAFALAYLGVDQFWLSKRVDEQKSSGAATPTSPSNPSVAPAIPDKSIAVLPFVNMSPDKDQEYFADGIAEELLNLLAQVPDLKVIARTSSFAFKGEKIEIAEIAKKLNVAHVVEGSVRKSGNKLRITAQLVRTADSTHLWSERYDRPMDDIFAVQDEIASAIVQALQIRLDGGTLSRRSGGTQNLEAYQLYLRGVSATNQHTKSSLDAAEDFLNQAVKLDPEFGLAWYQLAAVASEKHTSGYLTIKESYDRMQRFAQHALQLSPDIAEAHIILHSLLLNRDLNWQGAKAELQRALAIDPNNAQVLQTSAIESWTLGDYEIAESRYRAAMARDPLDIGISSFLALLLSSTGQLAEAESLMQSAIKRQPDREMTRFWLAMILLEHGKVDQALAASELEPNEGARITMLPMILHAAGRKSEADAALRAQIELLADEWPQGIAMSYAYMGDNDRALEWLERAYRQQDPVIWAVNIPLYRGLLDDPRYKAFLRDRLKLPDEAIRRLRPG